MLFLSATAASSWLPLTIATSSNNADGLLSILQASLMGSQPWERTFPADRLPAICPTAASDPKPNDRGLELS